MASRNPHNEDPRESSGQRREWESHDDFLRRIDSALHGRPEHGLDPEEEALLRSLTEDVPLGNPFADATLPPPEVEEEMYQLMEAYGVDIPAPHPSQIARPQDLAHYYRQSALGRELPPVEPQPKRQWINLGVIASATAAAIAVGWGVFRSDPQPQGSSPTPPTPGAVRPEPGKEVLIPYQIDDLSMVEGLAAPPTTSTRTIQIPQPPAISGPVTLAKPSGPVTSKWGPRVHPVTGSQDFHSGVDFGLAHGTPVPAAASGTVVAAGKLDDRCGYGVKIFHGQGITSIYCHGSKVHVKKDDIVQEGQIIMDVGASGTATGPHLHFGVKKDGEFVDPNQYFRK
jgi:murein DD-endopeptidase MepM/ murein hydrolase activator NlpD